MGEAKAAVAAKAPAEASPAGGSWRTMSARDKHAFFLLVLLYMLQGVPVGLTFGTMPFLLQSRVGYAEIGSFMLSTYPYSLKLFWSPIVDCMYVDAWRVPFTRWTLPLGRRKSWIVPVQLIVGVAFLVLARYVDALLAHAEESMLLITGVFFVLITLVATQDIAVDGWALTLLSSANVGYASTAQTIGVNFGYFMSFTVFLALNSTDACNKYFRWHAQPDPILTLPAYLQMCGVAFIAVTLWLLFTTREKRDEERIELTKAYKTIWDICKLRHVQLFLVVHMICKIGYQANDAVTGLKLVERGLGREDLAFAVLLNFPFQMLFGYLTATWSRGDTALVPWMWALVSHLVFSAMNMAIVAGMSPSAVQPISTAYFLLIVASTMLNSFAGTVQFVGITAFHTRIADPAIGGTYMTLLNTVSNLGGTWPRYFVLKMVDYFNDAVCTPPVGVDATKIANVLDLANTSLGECTSEAGKAHCERIGGVCAVVRDGYFATSTICIAVGAASLLFFIVPVCRHLQRVPPRAWHIVSPKSASS